MCVLKKIFSILKKKKNTIFYVKTTIVFIFLFLGILVASYMARKNPGFCKQIEQWGGLYYIKKMIDTLIFMKEMMPLIIDITCLTLLVLVFFSPLKL